MQIAAQCTTFKTRAPAGSGHCEHRSGSAWQNCHKTERSHLDLSLQSTLYQGVWRSKLVTAVEASQQDQACVQTLRTDSQRCHSQILEIQVHTSHLQPVEVPLGFQKLANQILSGCCLFHDQRCTSEKGPKGVFGNIMKCCLWRSQSHPIMQDSKAFLCCMDASIFADTSLIRARAPDSRVRVDHDADLPLPAPPCNASA